MPRSKGISALRCAKKPISDPRLSWRDCKPRARRANKRASRHSSTRCRTKAMPTKPRKLIRRRALRLEQDRDHPLYQFSLTGEELLAVADVSRISRDEAGKLIGYQRAEVKRHVQDIVDYLDGEHVVFANSIILAVSSAIRFTRSRGPEVDDGTTAA